MLPSQILTFVAMCAVANASINQAEATRRCEAARPGTVAQRRPGGTGWTCVVPPPPPVDDPCFEEAYNDPRTGEPGCCPDGQPYSYDLETLEGACCPTGQGFSWDAASGRGGCCSAQTTFTCSCQAPPIGKSISNIGVKLECDG